MYLACVTRKEISFTYLPVGKDQLRTHASSVMPFQDLIGLRCPRVSNKGIVPMNGILEVTTATF